MKYLIVFLFALTALASSAQSEFHVFPVDGKNKQGSANGNGSIEKPWDLQTALSQTSQRVNGGDIIWLHQGIYNGRYKSTIESTIKNKFITVSAYKKDKVVLNGNIKSDVRYVLEVNGSRVVYKNFEITLLGRFSRITSESDFMPITGISHIKGEDCKFQNLSIYNIPGSAIGSWKLTGGTVIEDCLIYNNGYQSNRGHGVGIYVQNQSDKIRRIRNNIIFNNYYKGIEVWSATTNTQREFVKNVNLTDNIIFNNGMPSGKPWSNLIIASGDNEGVNVAKHIKVHDNVFYHNIDFTESKNYGYGNSITLGYNANALVEDISIKNNIILGRNNALNIMHVKSLEFKNNRVYSGYIHFETSTLPSLEAGNLVFEDNKFYTRKQNGFRVLKNKDYKLSDWQKKYGIDNSNEWKQLKGFQIEPVLKIKELETKQNQFNVVLLEKERNDVMVDFSEFKIKKGTPYKIYDIENRTIVIASGKVSDDKKIKFSMTLPDFEKPLHNTIATKSASNFGVYRIVFEAKKKKKGFFKRFFGWLF